MYEELSDKLRVKAWDVKLMTGTVPMTKYEITNIAVAMDAMNRRIRDLELTEKHLKGRVPKLEEENDHLECDLRYLLQQIQGPPVEQGEITVRLPDKGGLFRNYFVLRPEQDPAAVAALRAYAEASNNPRTAWRIGMMLGEMTEEDEPPYQTAMDIIANSLMETEKRLAAEGK